jgi:hypothetical protein
VLQQWHSPPADECAWDGDTGGFGVRGDEEKPVSTDPPVLSLPAVVEFIQESLRQWRAIMDVQYSPESRRSPEAALLEQASTLLADILGPQSSQLVKAEWTRVQDHQGRTLYRLTIRDHTGEASTDFAPDELQNRLHMGFRLYRLWGDLLQIRNNLLHQQVQILSGEITTG